MRESAWFSVQTDDYGPLHGLVCYQCPEPFGVSFVYPSDSLAFYGQLEIADDKVNFEAGPRAFCE